MDVEAEKAKIQKEMNHLNGFLKGVRGKLSNERFVQNAPPQVVELERKKESDALAKLNCSRQIGTIGLIPSNTFHTRLL